MSQVVEVPGMGAVEFPDGMSDAEMAAAIKRSLAPAVPQGTAGIDKRSAPSYGALLPNAANKAIARTADLFLNAPTNVWNLAKAGAGTVATAAGRPDLAPDLTKAPDLAQRGMTAAWMIRPEAEPVGTTQRIVDAATQGATGMAMNPASSGRALASLAGAGALSGAAAQGTKEATGSNVAAQSVGILTPLGINMAANAARANIARLEQQRAQNAPRDQALQAGIEAGLQVPPTMMKPGDRMLEGMAGKVAVQQATAINNAEKVNALARKSIGLPPEAPLTPEVVQKVRSTAYQTGYEPMAQLGPVYPGAAYKRDLDAIASKYEGAAKDFPTAVRNDVREMIGSLRVGQFDAGNGIKMSQTLRDDASTAFRVGDNALGKAKLAAAKAIEDQIERTAQTVAIAHQAGVGPAGPDPTRMLDNFRDARRLMAQTHTVEDALIAGTGNVDARKFGAALQAGVPLVGEQKIIGEFAKNYPKAVQPPSQVGSPGVSKLNLYGTGLMGSAVGAGIGGALGGLAAQAGPPLAQRYLLSERHQRGLVPKYDPSLADMLFAPIPNLSSGAMIPPALLAEELRRQGR
jgi:hypothetical protein